MIFKKDPSACKHCGKMLGSKETLQDHEMIHLNYQQLSAQILHLNQKIDPRIESMIIVLMNPKRPRVWMPSR